jgi:hypothetical protein
VATVALHPKALNIVELNNRRPGARRSPATAPQLLLRSGSHCGADWR